MANPNGMIASLGLDGDSFRKEIRSVVESMMQADKTTKTLDTSVARMGRNMGKSMRGGMGQAGNVAMQVQDIAVSLQGGMSGLQVMGQQGSQLLSIFGPKGMLAGGVIAVGGALAYMGKVAKDSFDKTIASSYALTNAVGANINFSSLSQANDYVRQLREQMTIVKEEYRSGGKLGFSELVSGGIGLLMGGKSDKEKQAEQIKAQGELTWKGYAAEQRAVQLSAEDIAEAEAENVKLAEQLNGRKTHELELLKSERELKKEIGDIEQSNFARTTKNQLTTDAETRRNIRDQAIELKQNRQEFDEQRKLETQVQRINEREMEVLGTRKTLVDAVKREFEFKKKIEDALMRNQQKEAVQLARERDIERFGAEVDEELKTPQQQKAERDEEKKRKKAARIVASRARRKAQAAAGAGFGGFVPDGAGKAAGVPDMQPNAAAGAAAAANGGNQMKVDTLVVKTLKHG